MYKYIWYCRWCGKHYRTYQNTERDGFCCTAHKQAHHRAYKKYVTRYQPIMPQPAAKRVTQKKKKK